MGQPSVNVFALCGGCFFWVGILVLVYLVGRMWWRGKKTLQQKRWYTLLALSLPAAAIGLLYVLVFVLDDRTQTQPTAEGLSGIYTTTDTRAPGATVRTFPDGRYEASGIIALGETLPASGQWRVENFKGYYELTLGSWHGFVLHGESPPYEIGVFVSDPDEGEVTMTRQIAATPKQ